MKEDRHRASKHDLEEEKEKYYSKLAQPKDKWAVGRELSVLAKQFPHDRVLQRMLTEEMKSNPTFRAPENLKSTMCIISKRKSQSVLIRKG